ncbi:hypothetical protein [Aquimarina sp. I32.4]|uniref:hypothetical protein n=1 Tax=Aquimarina sp. I32.4 TaxID=2053903 RepID=UPI000CDE8524|nr:hypothetical protein [Aquimarina sp. I32.4]
MNKYYLLAIALLGVMYINAQDLVYKIPKEANAVASLKGENLIELFPIQEFDKTKVGKEILREATRNRDGQQSVADLGLDISSTGYYFYQITDSIKYHCMLMPINDVQKFEKLIRKGKIEEEEGFKINYREYSKESVIAWNDKMVLSVTGEIIESYFTDNKVRELYDLPEIKEGENGDEELGKYLRDDIFEKWAQKEEITFHYVKNKVDQILNTPITNKQSILANREYVKTIDKKAEASIWVSDFMKIYSDVMKGKMSRYYSSFLYAGMDQAKYERQQFSGHVYAEKDELKMKATYHLDKKMASRMKKVYGNSLNKKFLKYINEDEILGYASYVIDTKGFLTEYPKMMKNNLGGLFETEADIITELLSIVLDEKAISKVIKGDALFVMYDLSDKEVTYKTYKYDDDFKQKEVEKTRTETIPDFLLLLSSSDTDILKKLLKLGEEKGVSSYKDGVYTLKHRELPTELYVSIDQGVIAVGTTLERIKGLDTSTKNVSQKHRKILRKNSGSIYINTKEVLEIAKKFERSKRKKRTLDYIINDIEDIQLTNGKVRNNKMTAELKMKLPEGHKNGLKYLMTLIENLDK